MFCVFVTLCMLHMLSALESEAVTSFPACESMFACLEFGNCYFYYYILFVKLILFYIYYVV